MAQSKLSFRDIPGGMSLLRRILLVTLPLIAVAFSMAFIWMLDQRLTGYGFRLTPYPTVYFPQEFPTITGFSRGSDALDVRFSSSIAGTDMDPGHSQQTFAHTGRREVEIPLVPGAHQQQLRIGSGESSSRADFATIHAAGADDVVFSSSQLLVGKFRQFPLADLVASAEDFSADQIYEAREILRVGGVSPTDSVSIRLEKVFGILDAQLANSHGSPPRHLSREPPLHQYRQALAGEVMLDCGNFAEIFLLFATAAELDVRIVDAIRRQDGVMLASHTFNEVYLPELGRWAYVDLSLRTMSIRSGPSGPPMNAVQLAQLHQAAAYEGLYAVVQREGELQAVPYLDFDRFIRLHITANAIFVFHTTYRDRYSIFYLVRRYVLDPEPAYSLHGNNWPHYTKLAMLAGAMLSGLAWIALLMIWWLRPRRR